MVDLTINDFQAGLRASARGLWNGTLTFIGFIDGMITSIERGFEQAWQEGAAECGIAPEERTTQEAAALNQMLLESISRLGSFGVWIMEHSKENGGKLRTVYNRLDMWTNRYNEVVNIARGMSCADGKLKWIVGPTEHCRDCLRLNGKVKRASYWQEAGIRPQMRELECGGYRCQCRLEQTDEPMSKGPLPKPSGR